MILLADGGDRLANGDGRRRGIPTHRRSPPDIDVGSAAGRLKQLHKIARIHQQNL